MKNNVCTNIFREISAKDNEIFSDYSKNDLDDFLYLLNNYKLKLRDTLDIPVSETFGLEIESEYADFDKIERRKLEDWDLDYDMSLFEGAELKSPILRDTKENWYALKKMCALMKKYSQIGFNSGAHVHVGHQALGDDKKSFINFMKLWAVFEHVIYRFSYGEYLGPRAGIKDTARSVRVDYVNLCGYDRKENLSKDDIIYFLSDIKYKAVNFKNYNTLKTIEFRTPNGTLNPVVWQNNVNLFVKMLLYSKASSFDEKNINERYNQMFTPEKLPNEIYLEDALKFVDLVFDNNMDKIYF